MKKQAIILIILLNILQKIQCDLPVHCLRDQITGKWTAELTSAKKNQQLSCGHTSPDNEKTNYKALENNFEIQKRFDFNLYIDQNDNNICESDEGTGSWTMVYDEGFEISIGKLVLFAHSHYFPTDDSNWQSQCDETSVGWWHDLNSNDRGCFRASKIGFSSKSNEISARQASISQNLHVVQPTEYQSDKINHKKKEINDESLLLLSSMPKTQENFKMISDADKYGENWEEVDLSSDFTEHQKIVDRLNSPHIKKSWTAETNDQWSGYSMAQLNLLAGRRRKKFTEFLDLEKKNNNSNNEENFKQYSLNDLSDLPQSKSFRNAVGEIREQGSCGSCYIFATMGMLQARLKLKYNEDVQLSVQHPIDCDYYNQGCDGGYSYLVNKFASERELVTEQCHPYKATNGQCTDSCNINSEEKLYKVTNYRFVGGQYGHSNERNIMQEMMKNGPLVVSFEPSYEFMSYSSGIYHSVDANSWIKNREKRPDWEKVDHSVLLVGWGEENGEKYWELQNTWGENWGENGFFRIRRGTDESNIESMAEAADPIIIKREQSSLIQQKEPDLKDQQEVEKQEEQKQEDLNFTDEYGFLSMLEKNKKNKKQY